MLNTNATPQATDGGINPRALLDIDDPQYQAPTVADVHALKTVSGWTRGKIAGRLDCTPKQVDKWLAASSSSTKPIPYTAWRVWLLDSGAVTVSPESKTIITTDINPHTMHHEAGEAFSIRCPICNKQVLFAQAQWWESECDCGEWELIPMKAVLTKN